uniref:J domain-containing protein n=1 Tax=viral metagenome TaxID=1070528 RepID=A0A6C0KZB8_9ZZZZ
MSTEDYYKLLEISENASQEEVKKSYRKLSLKWHPDKNPGNPDASLMFQKISEAYETIGDAEKRQEYDMMKKNPFLRGQNFEQGMPFNDMNDLFSMFFNSNGNGNPMQNQTMHQMHHPMQGFPPEMAHLFGGMGIPGGLNGGNIRIFRNGVQVNPMMEKPVPIVKNITITMEQVFCGGNIPIEIERWVLENGNKVFETVTIYIEIFKGIDNNEIIILRDQGNVMSEKCKGDVKIFIKVDNHCKFERKGLDLIYIHKISLKESLCGFSFDLKHLNGKSYTINNKSGNIIPPNYNKIIPNMGLTREGHNGNMIVQFEVDFPTTLTSEQLEGLSTIL